MAEEIRTILIYPGIAGKGFNSLKQGMDSGWVSHGVSSIAAYGRSQGLPMDLVDLRALTGWDHFREEIETRRPRVVGITMMSVDYNPGMRAAEIVKEVDPSIATVFGGAHPTIAADDLLEDPSVDYVIQGEGEITFANLVRAIGQGRRPKERLLIGIHPNLDRLPFADRDLFIEEWRKYGYDLNSPEVPFVPELPAPFVTIIAGRGCQYKCNFCKPMEDFLFGKGTRRRSVQSVINELKWLYEKYHFASFMFHDDCLTEDRKWVTEFCQAYKAEGFTQPFFCQSRADIIVHTEDMVELMASVGLNGYFIGFESGSSRVLNFIRKGTTREKNIGAAQICRKYGITVWANYMLGLPTETKEEIKETISMLKIIDPDYYSPAFFTPYPGSDLYDYVMENNLSLVASADAWSRNPNGLKIKGHDLDFLIWAVRESQRRTLPNRIKRGWKAFRSRYLTPQAPIKAVRKVMRIMRGLVSPQRVPVGQGTIKAQPE